MTEGSGLIEHFGPETKSISLGPEHLSWLRREQKVNLLAVRSNTGRKGGWHGSCIEKDSQLDKVAARLSDTENAAANRLWRQGTIVYLNGGVQRDMHSIESSPGDPTIISFRNDRLRVYCAVLSIDGKQAVIKIAQCRKIDQASVLRMISRNPNANIQ